MILGEVGKNANGKADAVYPMLHQRMGGDLHYRIGAAGLCHLRKQPLQLQGIRRGALRRKSLLFHEILHRADEAGL